MGRIVVSEFVTLDGVMEAPGGEYHPDGKAGWTFHHFEDAIGALKYEELAGADALLLGRVSYEHFAKAWPTMTDTGEFGERMNSLPKHVVSTTAKGELEWNATAIEPGEVGGLRDRYEGDVLVAGSAELVRTLLREDLVDVLRLLVFPVVLGGGRRLFRDGSADTTTFALTGTKTFDSGVVALTYERAAAE